jgi:cupin superfamily acireductone dioxygenase involved in methionine salvage
MKRKTKTETDVILHGEAMIFNSALPQDAKKIKASNKEYHIIADSETTGNHHVISAHEGVEFYMDGKGTMFMVNEKETDVRCLHPDRHDAISLPPGTYEFGIAQEYDHIAQQQQKVRD